MYRENFNNTAAVVLGGYVNGYSIIKELYNVGSVNIVLIDDGNSLARYSNKVKIKIKVDNASTLLSELIKLNELFDYIIIYPTDDLQLESLLSIYDEIRDFCYLPFNPVTLKNTTDKFFQYNVCEKIGVPYPKTLNVRCNSDLDKIELLDFPLLVKPSTRKDLTLDVFRTLYLDNLDQFIKNRKKLASFLSKDVEFIVSEFIPGDDTNIFAYTCFRSQDGKILNEWTGKKLTQYPDNYGIFSSASNEAPDVVAEQGRALVHALDAFGIVEPEFKFDFRDGKYKLMETNLRSMMWHRLGSVSGVKLQEAQYKYALGLKVDKHQQNKVDKIHLVLMLHEFPNLIARKGYWKHFKYNVFGAEKREWAIFDSSDLKPFLYSNILLIKMMIAAWLRRFGLR
ncbi:hypothetical protein QWY82_14385 [Simiduia curdlanivorans]|uniref:ATP-grasp domain-containing protein n=1 Tax=Simiduia curdlanivorans TaxID=1492769 RepID=A0ABV8V3C8_9GAMM|nr:hypothetical protein [Simiduia curdlanivorans]MDN3639987.1 hypothetical protein [Simiduia curdlanivorans]